MTQEALDMVVHAYCEGCQEFIGDYELDSMKSKIVPNNYLICIENKNITQTVLPWEWITESYTPKEKAKVVIKLVKQIIENGDQWLQDEKDYHADKLAERWDNDRKSDLEND